MNKRCLFPLLGLLCLFPAFGLQAREFTVMAYNVNNLFDVDGKAHFSEFGSKRGRPSSYTPEILLTKIRNTTEVIKTVDAGRGPDILLLQELEYDLTNGGPRDYESLLNQYADTTVEHMLTSGFNEEIRDLPAEFLLYKYFEDNGLDDYELLYLPTARENPGQTKPHVNVTFSRFPAVDVRAHPTQKAREILETTLEIDGQLLTLFNNHWKSGAGDRGDERTRIQNATVLRQRLDEFFEAVPQADIIIGGDLNSHYNQEKRYRFPKTALHDVLGSQGNEADTASPNGAELYNLWYELPPEQRRTDAYSGEWGTLMHFIISRGLYDYRGIQYVDNSLEVIAIPGLNAGKMWGLPVRPHRGGKAGGGYSDHFPILATFRTVDDNNPGKFMTLADPATESGDTRTLKVDYGEIDPEALLRVEALKMLPPEQYHKYYGQIFEVRGELLSRRPAIKAAGSKFDLWSFDRSIREQFKRLDHGTPVHFYGQLSEYRGRIQFIIRDKSWILH